MKLPASVAGRDRLRLFCALRLPDPVLERVLEWQHRELRGVEAVRAVRRENLHLTLAFLSSRPVADVDPIVEALRLATAGAGPIEFLPSRYRETRSVGMVVLRDLHGTAAALAADLHGRLEGLGVYQPERRRWLAHLTVVRFNRPPGLRPSLPEIGRFSPSDAALYTSVLRPGGAQYEVLEAVALGG